MDYENIEFIEFEVPASKISYIGDKDNPDYVKVWLGSTYFLRSPATMKDTGRNTFVFQIPKYNFRGEEYKVELNGYVTVPGKEEKQPTEFTVTAMELKELLDEEIAAMKEEKEPPRFVAIKISKKRFVGEPWQTENMKEPYQTIFAPDGYTYSRPISKLHEVKEQPGHVMIYLPEKRQDGTDYMIRLSKSEKQENGEYDTIETEMSSSDLANYYKVEKNQYKFQKAKENDYVELIISKAQVVGKPWTGNDGIERRNIIAPDGYTFSRKSTQLHEIKDDPDHLKINLPKSYASGDDYTILLAKSLPKGDGTYEKVTKEMTSVELIESYEAAKQNLRRARGR